MERDKSELLINFLLLNRASLKSDMHASEAKRYGGRRYVFKAAAHSYVQIY